MKIKDIIEIEKNNEESIYLFKEGIFWRCYEYSAWRFVKQIKDYKVFEKHIKAVEQDIVYLGFPESALDIIKETNIVNKNEDNQIFINGFPGKEGFAEWKADVWIETDKPRRLEKPARLDTIIKKIKEYPITEKTPMESFLFLAEIKKEINGDI